MTLYYRGWLSPVLLQRLFTREINSGTCVYCDSAIPQNIGFTAEFRVVFLEKYVVSGVQLCPGTTVRARETRKYVK